LLEKVPAKWQQPAVAFVAFLLGLVAGGGADLWRQAGPAPPAFRLDEHDVELVLIEAEAPRVHPERRGLGVSPQEVDGALLLSGGLTSTVFEIGALDRSLEIRAPSLPATVSPTSRLQPVSFEIIVRDCKAASRWEPGDRPFTIRWRDKYGAHLDRAGDFGRPMANSLIRYIDAVCANR
jgi:hypothetical protein